MSKTLKEFQTEQPTKAPKGWEPSIAWNGQEGTITTGPLENEPDPAIWHNLIADWGLDPNLTEVVDGTVQVRAWDANLGAGEVRRFKYYRATIRPRQDVQDRADIDALCKLALSRKPLVPSAVITTPRSLVVLLTDWQLGNGENGGSEAITNRILASLQSLVSHIKALKKLGRMPEAILLIGLGDIIEQCSGFYCVEANTPVLTDDLRWVPAHSLREGDGLYACDETASSQRGRQYKKAVVLDNKTEIMDALRVNFSDGGYLICTPEHPLLCQPRGPHAKKARWVSAGDLVEGDRIAKISEPWPTPDTYDIGWLAGLYDGEGHFSAGRERGGPNILGLSQLSGPVLDRARSILTDLGVDFAERIHPDSGVVTLTFRGGYPALLRLLGMTRPERLIAKLGEPMMQSEWVRVESVESTNPVYMARLATSSHTYFANGYVSHNSMQEFSTDLDRRSQKRLGRRLLLAFVDELLQFKIPIVLGAVPGNHGENRRKGKAYTTWTDSDDLAVFEEIAEVLSVNPERYELVSVPTGAIADDLTMTLDVSGVITGFAHGHQMRSGGPTAQGKLENWFKGQVLGNQPVANAQVLFTGHLHHFVASEATGRTVIQCPAMDNGSYWFTSTTGQNSPAGMLVVGVGTAYGRRGWGDLQIL